MGHDALALVALIHRLAAIDARARERVARLLGIRERQAAVLLGLADGRALRVGDLAAELDMSPGGARAFAHRLHGEALVRPEPAARHERGVALRLAPGAANELAAALAPLTDRLEPIASATVPQLAAIVERLSDR